MDLSERLELVRNELAGNRWNKSAMSKAIGVSRFSLINIGSGKTPNPGIVTVQKIENYMEQMRANELQNKNGQVQRQKAIA